MDNNQPANAGESADSLKTANAPEPVNIHKPAEERRPANGYKPVEVKVWGDFACFTRPDMKAERVSYPVMTPSSARGVLEAIFWKPEFQWKIQEIVILKEIKHFSILRNEVNSKLVESSARAGTDYYADEDRSQRHSLVLRDVSYIIRADVCLRPHATDSPAKYRDQFRRRVRRGQCHHVPYLGCREFSGFFTEPSEEDQPINYSSDLGLMLFDLDYDKNGAGKPLFFRGRINDGILSVPPDMYDKLTPHPAPKKEKEPEESQMELFSSPGKAKKERRKKK